MKLPLGLKKLVGRWVLTIWVRGSHYQSSYFQAFEPRYGQVLRYVKRLILAIFFVIVAKIGGLTLIVADSSN